MKTLTSKSNCHYVLVTQIVDCMWCSVVWYDQVWYDGVAIWCGVHVVWCVVVCGSLRCSLVWCDVVCCDVMECSEVPGVTHNSVVVACMAWVCVQIMCSVFTCVHLEYGDFLPRDHHDLAHLYVITKENVSMTSSTETTGGRALAASLPTQSRQHMGDAHWQ